MARLRFETSGQVWTDSNHLGVIKGDRFRGGAVRDAIEVEARFGRVGCGDSRECLTAVAVVAVIGVGVERIAGAAEYHDAMRVLDWKGRR